MIPWTEKYHSCSYCHKGTWFSKGTTHKIYIRSKDKGRNFVAIAWYCANCKIFELDDIISANHEREIRLKYDIKPEDNFQEKLESVAETYRMALGG